MTKVPIKTLLISSLIVLASCGNQSDPAKTSISSTSTTSTSSTLAVTTTSTVPLSTWLQTATEKQKCLKVKDIFDPLPKAGAISSEVSEKYVQLAKIAGSLEWSDAYFMTDWDYKKNAGIIKRLLKYGCGLEGYDE